MTRLPRSVRLFGGVAVLVLLIVVFNRKLPAGEIAEKVGLNLAALAFMVWAMRQSERR